MGSIAFDCHSITMFDWEKIHLCNDHRTCTSQRCSRLVALAKSASTFEEHIPFISRADLAHLLDALGETMEGRILDKARQVLDERDAAALRGAYIANHFVDSNLKISRL